MLPLESWGEGLFSFRELGSNGNFRGAGKQAFVFGEISGALPKSKKENG